MLGVVGLGRVGKLVAQRALAFGMRLLAYDPFVSPDRGRQISVDLVPLPKLMAESDFVTIHLPKTAETVGLLDREMLGLAKRGVRIVNTARGGIIDEEALAWAIPRGSSPAPRSTSSPRSRPPSRRCSTSTASSSRRTSAPAPREAQDKAGDTIAEQVMLALAGEFVPFAVNVSAAEASESVRPYLPLVERLGQLFAELNEGAPNALDVEYQGALADYDTRILTLSALKGLFSRALDEPVTFVNAPQIAKDRGVEVREVSTPLTTDYVNLITVRSEQHSIAGTLVGLRGEPRLVMIDDHKVYVPPAVTC